MRVYAVFVDTKTGRVGLNVKDCLLPAKAMRFEGLINLFGGGIEEGETPERALARELDEELPGFIRPEDLEGALCTFENDQFVVFAVPTDLSGHRHTRETDRIGQLHRCCLEGESAVRTIEFVRNASDEFFLAPTIRQAVIQAYEALAA